MAQLSALGAAAALGAAGGLVYDLLRVLRRRRPGLTHAADGLFALLCLLGTLWVLTQQHIQLRLPAAYLGQHP